MFIVIAADTITRSDTQTYNHCSTPQYMLETSLGTLAPEPGERFYFPIYVIVTVAVAITICCCISMIFITVRIKNSTLVCRETISRVNNQHHEIAEPVDATISDTGDSVGEMQVEMTMWHMKVFTSQGQADLLQQTLSLQKMRHNIHN